jgi:hypothetical protein
VTSMDVCAWFILLFLLEVLMIASMPMRQLVAVSDAAMPCEGGLICGAHGSYGMTGAVRL